jgi:hypothetical protein
VPGGAAVELAPRAVAAFRLRRQRLAPSSAGAAEDLVALSGALGGVQAQVLEGAEHAVALRAPGADVRDALWRAHSLVRTYTWRGTFHLVPAAELELWLAAAAPGMPKPPKVPAERHDALAQAIGEALDGEPLTRAQLGRRSGAGSATPRWASAWAPRAATCSSSRPPHADCSCSPTPTGARRACSTPSAGSGGRCAR